MKITVIKQNFKGQETWRYPGTVIKRSKNFLVIEAFFDHNDMEIHGLWLCKGDRFLETYFFDRWYNIFEIHDHTDGNLKGWYCNISSPAIENEGHLIYQDFELDLLVFPDGRQVLVDEEDFQALIISPEQRKKALASLIELKQYFFDIFTAG